MDSSIIHSPSSFSSAEASTNHPLKETMTTNSEKNLDLDSSNFVENLPIETSTNNNSSLKSSNIGIGNKKEIKPKHISFSPPYSPNGSNGNNTNSNNNNNNIFGFPLTPSSAATSFPSSLSRKNTISRIQLKPVRGFRTIDWNSGSDYERTRRNRIYREPGVLGKLRRAFYSVQGWIIMGIIGVMCGIIAAAIELGTTWTFDLKTGICGMRFWLSKESCCLLYSNSDSCPAWQSWAQILHLSGSVDSYIANYLFFILWALFMAVLACWFVIIYAPYAAGGGIPEVKTYLGGFVIPKLLGFKVLVIKSIGLVKIEKKSGGKKKKANRFLIFIPSFLHPPHHLVWKRWLWNGSRSRSSNGSYMFLRRKHRF